MQQSADLTNSPLCTTENMRIMLQTAEYFDKLYPDNNADWVRRRDLLQQGRSSGAENPIGYTHSMRVIRYLFESLNNALVGNTGGNISLFDRIEEIRAQQEKTFKQIMSGEAPEFNDVIGGIVESKLKELGVVPGEKEPGNETEKKFKSVLQITNEALHAIGKETPQEEKKELLFNAAERIKAILAHYHAQTDAEEALIRLTALVNSISPKHKGE